MKIGIVTTFSDKGYEEYGKYFLSSCKKFLDTSITLYVYVDNIDIVEEKNIIVRNLESSVPELKEFKLRHKNKIPQSFLHDAVRFSHKSYCIYHASKTTNVDYLIWLDADTEIYNYIDQDYLLQFISNNIFVSFIGRPNYSETGFLAFNLNHSHSKDFFEELESYYRLDTIYTLEGQLDCHVFDAARKKFEECNQILTLNLSPEGITKNHFNHIFQNYMIHYKGDRKQKRSTELKKLRRD